MRALFIVQGEGRGHLTQVISLAQLLERAGHTVVGAWVNVAAGRPILAFFAEQFSAPIKPIEGPLLVYDTQTSALDLAATAWRILQNLGRYRRSLRQLDAAIQAKEPDIASLLFC